MPIRVPEDFISGVILTQNAKNCQSLWLTVLIGRRHNYLAKNTSQWSAEYMPPPHTDAPSLRQLPRR